MNAVGLNMPAQGTILPGTTIQLGNYTVVIDRYIAEGGFAHVYLATLANGGGFPIVVKRIAIADKERLAVVNKEIEIMKRLGRHKNIVEYMDSCMGKLEGGGYEVLILMEYCGGGPVIDLMNRRLQHRLTEPEILKIFSNVCEAVAYLHYSDPPILHRDIKVENILLSNNDYKLCDFGSATTTILRGDNIPRNVKDIQLLEEEINNHTTLQYRAPEMLDLYMRKGIDEKIDIWALGVLLYKLCYYTTPFEEQGQLAILNVRYSIPDHPVFSVGLMNLFKSMLKEDPRQRPNIYQVMKSTSALRGLPCPIHNIYPDVSVAPTFAEPQSSATANILTNSTAVRPMDVLPSIEPMRRGRPTRPQGTNTIQPTSMQADPSSGFDDSFGQFSQNMDPVSQFSKITPAGDAFDFGTSPLIDSGKKSDAKRFTLDFEPGKDEFGFKFQNSGPTVLNPAAPATSSRPRPLSITGTDILLPELNSATARNNVKSAMPSQLSGTNNGSPGKPKPSADDLFFGSSTGFQFESGDVGSRAATSSSFGSVQQTPIGLSSPFPNVGSQSSGVSRPLIPSRQDSQQSGHSAVAKPSAGYPNHQTANKFSQRNLQNHDTGASRNGSASEATPGAVSAEIPSRGRRPVNSGNSVYAQEQALTPVEGLELLQRQQMEQLGKFSLESSPALISQNTQGKAKLLDLSRTLDGMRSLDLGSRNGANSAISGMSASTSPALAPRPQAPTSPEGAPLITASASNLPPLDKGALAQRDLDTEMKLIQLQQTEFDRQQKELLSLQRRQLEEQQQQHRLQQEQLQKQQQQQIQLQHEKWQERKRMLKEQEQLVQRQLAQQRDLEKQHESQKQLQQQQQQQQQSPLPAISNLAASMASISLNTTNSAVLASTVQQQHHPNPYRLSLSGTGNGQQAAVIYHAVSPGSSTADRLSSLTGGRTTQSAYSSISSSPATSFQHSFSSVSPSLLDSDASPSPITPSVPSKSARRAMVNGTGTSTSTATSTSALSESAASAPPLISVKARRTSLSSLPPGQKPELLPKPTRFRMRDGTGTLVAGEEEAFKKKFPSADLDDDLETVARSGRSNGQTQQYMTPSQRARAGRGGAYNDVEEEDEEEEETLVRSRRRHYNTPSSAPGYTSTNGGVEAPQKQLLAQDSTSAEESSTPAESVRERVQRMNRVGRIV